MRVLFFERGTALYAEVIIDIAHANVDRLFTYRIPDELDIPVGAHVRVPFGHGNAVKEGFVLSLKEEFESDYAVKEIRGCIEPYSVLLPEQIALAQWMQKNYHCLLVESLRLMIPAQLRGGRVREKVERTVMLNPSADPDSFLQTLQTKNGTCRSPKQAEVIRLLQQSGLEMSVGDIYGFIPGSNAAVSALIRKNILLENGHVSFRRPSYSGAQDKQVELNAAQLAAVSAVTGAVRERTPDTFLLHGVTGSGKTEVYMHCIENCLKEGKEAIVLVPEISLTPQTVGRFQARFGDEIAVLHSRLSAGERFDEWRRIRLGKARVAVGARSAAFAPFQHLGLIIIDEEHETSYQSENAPRYHASEIAAHRASEFSCPLLLGSATPSLLSYFRATSGRYRLLELPERVMKRPMPEVEIIDMREEFLDGNNGIFSRRLVSLLSECIGSGHQAMLFLNRRGYSTFVSCRACGTVIQCPNCDISMTYHKNDGKLRCHFCGETAPVPTKCPECGKPFIKYFGIGTEQVEEQMHLLFPDVRTIRMDTDTMKGKNSFDETLSAFARGEAQVLIGTQMIAKGHDFPNVTLAGVVAADASLCIPDYRSAERTFQLLTQIAGRAGRDRDPGRVVIQTYSPSHPAVRFAENHDYKGFFRYELNERRKALFPPYTMFIRLLYSGEDEEVLDEAGERLGKELEQELLDCLGTDGKNDLLMLSCSPAPIRKKQGSFRYQILIKLLRTRHTADVLRCIYDFEVKHRNEMFTVLEVNPQDML